MPTAYGAEFRQDVIEVARKGEAPLAQIAKDFGLSVTTLKRWIPSPQKPRLSVVTIIEFADGRIVTHHDIADPTLTNVDTGKSLVHRSRFTVTESPSSVEGEVVIETRGQLFHGRLSWRPRILWPS